MNRKQISLVLAACCVGALAGFDLFGLAPQQGHADRDADRDSKVLLIANAALKIDRGRQTFRFDTFGSEAFWGGTLRLHEAVATLSPSAALNLGLKVDIDALPQPLIQQLRMGRVNLNDPAVTLELLRLNAVVGLTGFFNQQNRQQLQSLAGCGKTPISGRIRNCIYVESIGEAV
ncbi:MAG: hypothetical protein ACM3S5_09195 [Rhodospirillales bacterium]